MGRTVTDMTGAPTGGEQAAYLQIGEVAARTELSLRSLRHWEEHGLITPSGRSEGGFRLYTDDDVEQVLLVRRMKPLGFSLDRMAEVIADRAVLLDPDATPAERDAARARLEALRVEAHDARARLERQVEMADEFLDLLGDQLA